MAHRAIRVTTTTLRVETRPSHAHAIYADTSYVIRFTARVYVVRRFRQLCDDRALISDEIIRVRTSRKNTRPKSNKYVSRLTSFIRSGVCKIEKIEKKKRRFHREILFCFIRTRSVLKNYGLKSKNHVLHFVRKKVD